MNVFKPTRAEEDFDEWYAKKWQNFCGMAIPRTPIEPSDKSYKPIKIKRIRPTGCSCDFCKERRNETLED